jgi:hypothetical protein
MSLRDRLVIDQATTGASTGAILRRVNAISILHDRHNLADPTSTTAVRSVLADVVAAPAPPRSWTKEQQAEFKTFPIQAQKNIAAREQNREQHLRTKQNELAAAIKAAKTAPESSKPVNPENKEVSTNAE